MGFLGCHRDTTLFAFAATLDAFVHAADLLATVRARLADFRARFAVVGVVVAVAAHESDARVARGDAVEHQFDVFLLNVVATFGEARRGQHIADDGLALLAVLDAFLFGCSCGTHKCSPDSGLDRGNVAEREVCNQDAGIGRTVERVDFPPRNGRLVDERPSCVFSGQRTAPEFSCDAR